MLSSSDGTQKVEQISSHVLSVCVRYTLEHVTALHALDEELKVLMLVMSSSQRLVSVNLLVNPLYLSWPSKL